MRNASKKFYANKASELFTQTSKSVLHVYYDAFPTPFQVLHMLRGALPRHHFQRDDAAQDALLHRQPHHPLHGHLLPHRARVLPALRQWREGECVKETRD